MVGSLALTGSVSATQSTPIPVLPPPGDFVTRIDNMVKGGSEEDHLVSIKR